MEGSGNLHPVARRKCPHKSSSMFLSTQACSRWMQKRSDLLLTFPYTSLVWGHLKTQHRCGPTTGTFSILYIMCLSSDGIHPAALPALPCCSWPILVARSSEMSVAPTAYPDPLVCNLLLMMIPVLITKSWPTGQQCSNISLGLPPCVSYYYYFTRAPGSLGAFWYFLTLS